MAHPADDQASEQVVLAPHHALGHAGGTAGVEHQEVVTAATPGRHGAAGGRLGRVLVRGGPIGAGPGTVVDPEPALDPGYPVENALDPLAEGAVEHDCHRVGV